MSQNKVDAVLYSQQFRMGFRSAPRRDEVLSSDQPGSVTIQHRSSVYNESQPERYTLLNDQEIQYWHRAVTSTKVRRAEPIKEVQERIAAGRSTSAQGDDRFANGVPQPEEQWRQFNVRDLTMDIERTAQLSVRWKGTSQQPRAVIE